MKVLTVLIVFLLIACSEKKEKKQEKTEVKQTEVATNIKNPFMKQYFVLQNKLARDKFDGNAEIIANLEKELMNIELENKSDFETAIKSLKEASDINEQRKHFEVLSDLAYSYVKSNQLEADIYQMHCPMAFNNKGASWLQSDKYLLNPYYGSRMLRCGKVTETIAKK